MKHEIIVNKPQPGQELDIIIISGDAYVDHPSFGTAVIARVLQAAGYRVGIITQPDWRTPESVTVLGKPRLFFGITAGNLDSMLAHFTAFKKRRNDDAYTPGGKTGARPDRACIVYSNLVRQAYKNVPIILGGIEASMRRTIHYDYWDDKLRESLLVDAGADMLVYGMGEKAIRTIADTYNKEKKLPATVPGTAVRNTEVPTSSIRLPSWRTYEKDEAALVQAELQVRAHMHGNYGHRPLVQQTRAGDWIIINRPPEPMITRELDAVYELPYTRNVHPSYKADVPGTRITDFSIVSHRGCGGGCSFCSLAAHQGRQIRSRSAASIGREMRILASHKRFKGTIADIGGPTANAYGYSCSLKSTESCKRQSCFSPNMCKNFTQSGPGLLPVLKDSGRVPGVKHVHITSGIRHDLLLQNRELLKRIITSHVSGQLKVAPEHASARVLKIMKKNPFTDFIRFMETFEHLSTKAGRKQFLVPYFISGHPGCREKDMEELADFLKEHHWKPQQVQAFIPLPGTLAAAYYYARVDDTGKHIFVAKTYPEKRKQMEMLRWNPYQPARSGGHKASAPMGKPGSNTTKMFPGKTAKKQSSATRSKAVTKKKTEREAPKATKSFRPHKKNRRPR